eukprot:7376718-Prymnesium_polylepis.1
MGRQLRQDARSWERADRKEQNEYKAMKREQNLQEQLESLAEKGAIIVERFAGAVEQERAVGSHAAAVAATSGLSPTAAVKYLREQIEFRVLGFGWSDLAVSWKEGDEQPKVQVRRRLDHLRTILQEERRRERPTEPPLPDFQAKTLKELGTPTTDSLELA